MKKITKKAFWISRMFGGKATDKKMVNEAEIPVKMERSAEECLLSAVFRGDLEAAADFASKVEDINGLVYFDSVYSVDNGLDYVHYRDATRVLDVALTREDEAMVKLLRAFGARSSEKFADEQRIAEEKKEQKRREERLRQVDVLLQVKGLA